MSSTQQVWLLIAMHAWTRGFQLVVAVRQQFEAERKQRQPRDVEGAGAIATE